MRAGGQSSPFTSSSKTRKYENSIINLMAETDLACFLDEVFSLVFDLRIARVQVTEAFFLVLDGRIRNLSRIELLYP